MKKRTLAVLLCILLMGSVALPALADPTVKHNKAYEKVLFGTGGSKNLSPKAKEALTTLEYALYLSIDSYDQRGQEELDFLRKQGVNVLPENVSDFSVSSNSHHERYTHRGWVYTYTPDLASWHTIRKPLLISAVNNALDFGFGGWLIELDNAGWVTTDESIYDKKCVSFAALMYYVHILGDHSGNTYTSDPDRIPLGHRNPGETNRDIIFDLQEHLAILFADQADSDEYEKLMDELSKEGKKIRDLAQAHVAREDHEQYRTYASSVVDILAKYIPSLLKNEPFFANVFYK